MAEIDHLINKVLVNIENFKEYNISKCDNCKYCLYCNKKNRVFYINCYNCNYRSDLNNFKKNNKNKIKRFLCNL